MRSLASHVAWRAWRDGQHLARDPKECGMGGKIMYDDGDDGDDDDDYDHESALQHLS